MVDDTGACERILVDSCGTADWHVGRPPDARAVAQAQRHGYDLNALRARQLKLADFDNFDYILCMDSDNLSDLMAVCPADYSGVLRLFLDYPGSSDSDVPDPYYGGEEGFTHVLLLVETASQALLKEIQDKR